jgi:hypothetical protein
LKLRECDCIFECPNTFRRSSVMFGLGCCCCFEYSNTFRICSYSVYIKSCSYRVIQQAKALSRTGDSTVDECTRRILRDVLTNSFARNFNWAGRNGKLAFKKTVLCPLVSSELIIYSIYLVFFAFFKSLP